ncbi:MAG: dTMP kinase [Anaerolineaceae bacterium]|nr:dTMP kinase [Anaerolineaceae bacterium]
MARRRKRGFFLVLDGPEGSGKSTQVGLLAERLKGEGLETSCVRDPGGTTAGERIRDLLLDASLPEMDARTEMFLYMASRAEMVRRVIRPAIESGLTIVSDRFISSTVAYQGYAGGLDPREIVRVGKIACQGYWPDLVVLLDLPAAEGFQRIRREHDRMEQKPLAFHRQVVKGFRELSRSDPKHHVLVDARGAIETVARRVWKVVKSVVC